MHSKSMHTSQTFHKTQSHRLVHVRATTLQPAGQNGPHPKP